MLIELCKKGLKCISEKEPLWLLGRYKRVSCYASLLMDESQMNFEKKLYNILNECDPMILGNSMNRNKTKK